MGDLLGPVEHPLLAQRAKDRLGNFAAVHAGEEAEAGIVVAVLVDGDDDRQVLHLAQRKVLGPAAGGDVDDAGAFLLADVVPGDDAMLDARLLLQLVERSPVPKPNQLATF